ncbi:hypothetical protein ACEOWG_004635 [Bacillus cereus]
MEKLTTVKTLKLQEEAKKIVEQVVIQFYKCAERYYPDENLVDDALGMIENGAKFFESVNLWFAQEMKVSE